MKDLERISDLTTISRNLLWSTRKAQNLAVSSCFDQVVLKTIDICVRVLARGYDGDVNGRTESHWANIVSSCKKLLIICLQFLHNLVQKNEERKLMLWLDLFATQEKAEDCFNVHELRYGPGSISAIEKLEPRADTRATLDEAGKHLERIGNLVSRIANDESLPKDPAMLSTEEAARLSSQVMDMMDGIVDMPVPTNREPREQPIPQRRYFRDPAVEKEMPAFTKGLVNKYQIEPLGDIGIWTREEVVKPIEQLKAIRTPESAAMTLQAAKDQLMARLQDPAAEFDEQGEPRTEGANSRRPSQSEVDTNESIADDDEEDDGGWGPQERGLLTDVPLVLGPAEIEALPLLIQSGLVNKTGNASSGEKDMYGIRCNILLAQEPGRNLLRELLIFIAAWDLQDTDFYFKIMMEIMEAILENGLMPYAYQTFGEAKDIVSPAQSMVIKILTQIFRAKQGNTPTTVAVAKLPSKPETAYNRVDLVMVKQVFQIFRSGIVPETCALIYLQGRIRAGEALAEDFPLNLWDMERVYEGVYQFLEFFAVLTENEEWKGLLVEWEIVSELVTLLRELDTSIPKVPPLASTSNTTALGPSAPQEQESGTPSATTTPVAVERPYSPNPGPQVPSSSSTLKANQPHHLTTTTSTNSTTFPIPSPAAAATAATTISPNSPPLETSDPSEFEWRNLKKLVVLVLSSLVWKSTTVQDQIRNYGGVEMILNCCNFDANNPYIKEHAIMCLRFLLEGNLENQDLVRGLEKVKEDGEVKPGVEARVMGKEGKGEGSGVKG